MKPVRFVADTGLPAKASAATRFVLVALAWGLSTLGVAADEGAKDARAAEAAERSRITQERAAANEQFDRASRACYQRFAVTDCLEQARAQRRDRLGDLRRQEISLNDADRRRKAAEALQRAESRTER